MLGIISLCFVCDIINPLSGGWGAPTSKKDSAKLHCSQPIWTTVAHIAGRGMSGVSFTTFSFYFNKFCWVPGGRKEEGGQLQHATYISKFFVTRFHNWWGYVSGGNSHIFRSNIDGNGGTFSTIKLCACKRKVLDHIPRWKSVSTSRLNII